MGLFCSLLLLLLSSQLYAQSIKGLIVDKQTRIPVSEAKINTTSTTIYTGFDGHFKLNRISQGDTALITHPRYKSYHVDFGSILKDTVLIYLERLSILLKEVNITTTRDFRTDSLRIRKEFSNVFTYKAPTFKDIFASRSPYTRTISSKNASPYSSTSLVGLNLFNIAPYLTRHKSPVFKLQKTLLKDEESNYVKMKFSKERVVALTSLKGDSLEIFMQQHFPSITEVKKMTDYDLLMYIKKRYKEFVHNLNN